MDDSGGRIRRIIWISFQEIEENYMDGFIYSLHNQINNIACQNVQRIIFNAMVDYIKYQ